ncbi:H-NS histone family protein [Methylomonas montana]|uniref:H-NS histone family protein n=1 Tax=Methylomonas montana TaxID=3058963 RepID=UPI00265B0551|nr:H-NS histone family protein [Methylomonas montana]WKJ88603.1 H-NS histone family protein [Methylomonas montana]
MTFQEDTASYVELQEKIKQLQNQAEQARLKEIESVIEDIKAKIALYKIEAKDLGFFESKASEKKKNMPHLAEGKSTQIKYRDENGNAWGGKGARPLWLKEQLAKGKKLEDFEV